MNDGSRNYHSCDGIRQVLSMTAKADGQNFNEEQDNGMISVSPEIVISRRKKVTLRYRNLADTNMIE